MVYFIFIIIFLNKFLQKFKIEWMALIAKEIFDPAFGLF